MSQHLSDPSGAVMRSAGGSMTLNDSVYERLLRERIIVLGQQVDDAIANQISAQLLLLAAEDDSAIGMKHLARATRREFQKLGKLIAESDFEHHYSLLKAD